MKKSAPSILNDPDYKELYAEYCDVLEELLHMRDFVFQVSSRKRTDGTYNYSREALEVKARELLDKYEL